MTTPKAPKKVWPGSEPVTAREIQSANRRLIGAMKRHKEAKKRLAQTERELREAKTFVKMLVDLVARGGPQPVESLPRCGECQGPLGQNPTCMACSAVRSEFTPGGVAFDEALPVEVP
jgi:hypothetical protein